MGSCFAALRASLLVCFMLVLFLCDVHADNSVRLWSELERGYISEEECASIAPVSGYVEIPLNHDDAAKSETFKLFYFMNEDLDSRQPTVLFVDGGPGNVLGNSQRLAAVQDQVNIVYFHIRGAGCSQIPAENTHDRFLRTRFVVDDIEVLRKKLGLEKFAALVGESYGTKVAHLYAQKYPASVGVLIQEAISTGWEDRNEYDEQVRAWENFEKVVSSRSEFQGIAAEDLVLARNDFQWLLENVLAKIGGIYSTLINSLYYDRGLKTLWDSIRVDERYLTALYLLHYSGWAPTNEFLSEMQISSAAVILGRDFSPKLPADLLENSQRYIQSYHQSAFPIPEVAEDTDSTPAPEGNVQSRNAERVLRVINMYEGHVSTITQLQDGKTMAEILENSKVGLADDYEVKSYDPQDYAHSVSTLIIHGSADAILPMEGPQEYVQNALTGERLLVLVNGGGHSSILAPECQSKLFLLAIAQKMSEVEATLQQDVFCKASLVHGVTLVKLPQ